VPDTAAGAEPPAALGTDCRAHIKRVATTIQITTAAKRRAFACNSMLIFLGEAE